MSREREQRAVLLELLKRTRVIESAWYDTAPNLRPWRGDWEQWLERGPAFSGPEWFPAADETGLRRIRRAIVDLEAKWLVQTYGPGTSRKGKSRFLHLPGGRMTHVRLTAEGRDEAERIEVGNDFRKTSEIEPELCRA